MGLRNPFSKHPSIPRPLVSYARDIIPVTPSDNEEYNIGYDSGWVTRIDDGPHHGLGNLQGIGVKSVQRLGLPFDYGHLHSYSNRGPYIIINGPDFAYSTNFVDWLVNPKDADIPADYRASRVDYDILSETDKLVRAINDVRPFTSGDYSDYVMLARGFEGPYRHTTVVLFEQRGDDLNRILSEYQIERFVAFGLIAEDKGGACRVETEAGHIRTIQLQKNKPYHLGVKRVLDEGTTAKGIQALIW